METDMLIAMLLFRAAMTKRKPHPSLTRNETGPRDFVRLPAAKQAEVVSEQK
jgi:hypothetical protein